MIGVGIHIYMFVDQKNLNHTLAIDSPFQTFASLSNLWISSRFSLGLSSLVPSGVETKCSASTFRNLRLPRIDWPPCLLKTSFTDVFDSLQIGIIMSLLATFMPM